MLLEGARMVVAGEMFMKKVFRSLRGMRLTLNFEVACITNGCKLTHFVPCILCFRNFH